MGIALLIRTSAWTLQPEARLVDQQSNVAAASRQIRPICASSSRPRRRVSIAVGKGRRLSKLATDSNGMPSSGPTGSSLGTDRTRLVIGATSTRAMGFGEQWNRIQR